MDGKFSVGYRDAFVRTVVGLDRETTAAYTLVLEAIGTYQLCHTHTPHHQHGLMGQSSHGGFQGPGVEPKEGFCPEASEQSATKH